MDIPDTSPLIMGISFQFNTNGIDPTSPLWGMHCRAYVVIDFTPSLATNRFLKQIERRNGCSYQHGVTSNHGMIDPISLDDA